MSVIDIMVQIEKFWPIFTFSASFSASPCLEYNHVSTIFLMAYLHAFVLAISSARDSPPLSYTLLTIKSQLGCHLQEGI